MCRTRTFLSGTRNQAVFSGPPCLGKSKSSAIVGCRNLHSSLAGLSFTGTHKKDEKLWVGHAQILSHRVNAFSKEALSDFRNCAVRIRPCTTVGSAPDAPPITRLHLRHWWIFASPGLSSARLRACTSIFSNNEGGNSAGPLGLGYRVRNPEEQESSAESKARVGNACINLLRCTCYTENCLSGKRATSRCLPLLALQASAFRSVPRTVAATLSTA